MTTLLALASPAVYARALRQPPPADAEATVRVIGEGARAMGLGHVCAPWRRDEEVAAVRADVDGSASDGAGDGDQVATWLTSTPGHPPVVGVVSGPLALAAEVDAGDLQAALDAAADVTAERVRSLCEAGVDRLVVVERAAGSPVGDADLAREAHTPLLRLARHFDVPATLAALDDEVPAAALGYEAWASPGGGSDGVRLLTVEAIADPHAVAAAATAARSGLVVTEWLPDDVDPSVVRSAAAIVAEVE